MSNAFDAAMAWANAAILATFGEPCTVHVRGSTHAITGIVSRATSSVDMGGLMARGMTSSVQFDSAEFAATGAAQDDRVSIAGADYVIAEPPEPDDGGMIFVRLRAL